MTVEWFLERRILVVVAHQDDESLYFGGLLSTLAGRAAISLVSATAPMKGRPDTDHRMASFHRVGTLLACERVVCLDLPDCGPRGEAYPPDHLEREIAAALPSLGAFDIVLTHGPLGEPNAVYGRDGHEAHKATSRAVRATVAAPTVCCGLGADTISCAIEYDRAEKKALLDCYLPYWSPAEYSFVYDPERYVLIAAAPRPVAQRTS
jgi:LmbE family N-acetylglucosaminyl deacetylase